MTRQPPAAPRGSSGSRRRAPLAALILSAALVQAPAARAVRAGEPGADEPEAAAARAAAPEATETEATETEATETEAAGTGTEGPTIILVSGRVVRGHVLAFAEGSLQVEGVEDPIPLWELQEIRWDASEGSRDRDVDLDLGPLVQFQSGEQLAGRVLVATNDQVTVKAKGLPDLGVPLEAIRAFRVREAYLQDDRLERDLEAEASPPETDTIYVRRSGLLPVPGMFRGLSEEHVHLEYAGKARRIRRILVQGVVLAPVARKGEDPDPPQVLELPGVGRLPAYLVGVRRPGAEDEALVVRFAGAPRDRVQEIPRRAVRRVLFASDRVTFLSALEPVSVEQTPLVGTGRLPWHEDRSAGGTPISLGGRTYRKGLGMRSRMALEYDIGGRYRSFAAVVGLDDAAGGRGSVVFRVIADGKSIYERTVAGSDRPEPVSLPMTDVRRLRLEVDFGADGMARGDHADWADARVTR